MDQRINYQEKYPGLIKGMLEIEKQIRQSKLNPSIYELVKLRASQINGCAYCIDMHSKDARANGESEQRLYALSAWRETPFFSDRERTALEYTETLTLIAENEVSDRSFEQLRLYFDEDEVMALTMAIVAINGWNRLAISMRVPPGTYQTNHKS